MSLFGRREPLHERLAREGGLVEEEPRAPAPLQETGIHGIPRAREWDVTVATEAEGIEADAVRFVSLPDGTLLIEEGLVEEGPDGSLDPLATAVEAQLPPPYRARAARQVGDTWAVQARRLEVLALPDAPPGDRIEVARTADGTTLSVDGSRVFGSVPALEARGEREGREFVVRAERLDGDLFEIQASAL